MPEKESKPVLKPQFICMTCKAVIGPIFDDYENQCKCGPYDFEVWRVVDAEKLDEACALALELGNRLTRICNIIEAVDNRCLAADGPVIQTLQEMTQEEISEIYKLSK